MYAPVLSILLIAASGFGHSIARAGESVTQRPPGCRAIREGDLSFRRLKHQIQNRACNIWSIEGLLSQLPYAFRANYALAYRSQSPQGPHTPDFLNPRVLLTDAQIDFRIPESKFRLDRPLSFILAFNGGNQTSARHHSLEMVEVENFKTNATADFLGFHDITFPERRPGQTWEQVQSEIRYSERNPQECVLCHSNPARFIWSSYPLWPGFYGSSNFDRTNTEVRAYKSFVDHASRHPRYKYLVAPEKRYYLTASEGKTYEGLSFTHEGINATLNKRLALLNGRRFARTLKTLPDYEKYKFAYFGAWMGCIDIFTFLPSHIRSFHDANISRAISRNYQGTVDEFITTLVSIQKDYYKFTSTDIEKIKIELLGKSGSDAEFMKLLIDSFVKMGPYRGSLTSVSARYLSQPRRISMTDWFLDLQTGTFRVYTGGEPGLDFARGLLDEDSSFEPFRQYFNRDTLRYSMSLDKSRPVFCEELKQKSLVALSDLQEPALLVEQETQLAVVGRYPPTFVNTCAACHDNSGANAEIPLIEFAHPDRLEKRLRENPSFAAELLKRINAKDYQMPPNRHLEADELSAIHNYIEGLQR